MMRTGTSAVAGVLGLLGVRLGDPERLLPPNPANPTGFSEHVEVIAINDELLASQGGTWYAPPAFPDAWERDPALDDLRARARRLIAAELAPADRWGWKDPRTCLTLPFWQDIVPDAAYLICLRSPAESARSLAAMSWVQKRVEQPYERGLDLWLRYVRGALDHTEGRPRLLVSYDRLVGDGEREAARIAAFAGLEERLAAPESRAAVAAYLTPSLRHQRGANVTPDHPAMTLYAALTGELERTP
jgi:hypothetical protein